MKATTTPEGVSDAKPAVYAEQLVLLELVGTDGHVLTLKELERPEDPPKVPAGLRPLPDGLPGLLDAAEPDEPPQAQVPDGAQGKREAQAVGRGARRGDGRAVAAREREEGVEVLRRDLLRETRKALPLAVGQQVDRDAVPLPRLSAGVSLPSGVFAPGQCPVSGAISSRGGAHRGGLPQPLHVARRRRAARNRV